MKRTAFSSALAAVLAYPAFAVEPPTGPTHPAPVAQAAPVVLGPAALPGAPKTLADFARERKLNRTGSATGSFSSTESTAAQAVPDTSKAMQGLITGQAAAAQAAQERMNRATTDGVWTDKNIHYNTAIRNNASNEWDAAAENCRKTSGCTPIYRSDGARKVLKSDEERLFDYSQKLGVSGAKRPDYAP